MRRSPRLSPEPEPFFPAVHYRFPSDELPDVAIERTELFLNSEKRLRVGHRRVDFEPVADDPGFFSSRAFFFAVNRATFFGSNSANARR